MGVTERFGVSQVAATLGLTLFVAGYGLGPMVSQSFSPILLAQQLGGAYFSRRTSKALAVFSYLHTNIFQGLGTSLRNPSNWTKPRLRRDFNRLRILPIRSHLCQKLWHAPCLPISHWIFRFPCPRYGWSFFGRYVSTFETGLRYCYLGNGCCFGSCVGSIGGRICGSA